MASDLITLSKVKFQLAEVVRVEEHQKSIKASEHQKSIKASEHKKSIKGSEQQQLPMLYYLWIPRPVEG
jgi:hypothetical protein